jgi:DEAD/DEAH box helicase domain-containing protein
VADWLGRGPQTEADVRRVYNILAVATDFAGNEAVFAEMFASLRDRLLDEITRITRDDETYTQEALSERLANAGLLPMFGFPTRVRLLYTRWPQLTSPWPPERGLVDRPLDIAISQFAPGSETIKDKAVHRACGVVEMYPKGQEVSGHWRKTPDSKANSSLYKSGKCAAHESPALEGLSGRTCRTSPEVDQAAERGSLPM